MKTLTLLSDKWQNFIWKHAVYEQRIAVAVVTTILFLLTLAGCKDDEAPPIATYIN